jgi:hypothetical protein
MRSLTMPHPMALVTCCYDSLNYMLDMGSLGEACGSVTSILAPGGLFVADVLTPKGFEEVSNATYFTEGDGLAIVHRCGYDARRRRSLVQLTGFVREADGRYWRFDEAHAQWAPTRSEIRGTLRRAGLIVEGEYECFTFSRANHESRRVLWVARKRGAPSATRQVGMKPC